MKATAKKIELPTSKPSASKPEPRVLPMNGTLPDWAPGQELDREKRVSPDGKSVTTDFSITFTPDGGKPKSYAAKGVRFDFTGCSPAEILQLAAARCVIVRQTQAKAELRAKRADALAVSRFRTINVKADIVDTERKSAAKLSDAEKAERLFAKLSPAEQAALIARLSKK